MLSEIYEAQKGDFCIILLIGDIQNWQIPRDRKQIRGYQELGGGENGSLLFAGYRVSVGVKEMYWKHVVVMAVQQLNVIHTTELYTENG